MTKPAFAIIGYNPAANGHSSYLIVCACGVSFDFYCWSAHHTCSCGRRYVYHRTEGVVIWNPETHDFVRPDGRLVR